MSKERVIVVADGNAFEGWEVVTVQAAMNEVSRIFQVQVSEVPNSDTFPPSSFFQKWHFPPFTTVQVFAGSDMLLTGFVDEYRPLIAPEAHKVVIVGRGRSSLIADSSATGEPGFWEDRQADQIAKELVAPTGVPLKVEGGGKGLGAPLNYFAIRRGSTIYAEIMRILQTRMATLKGNADGSASIVTGCLGQHPGEIAQGKNIKQAEGKITGYSRFSDYSVLGQNDGTNLDSDIQPEGKASDGGVPMKKPKVIVNAIAGDKQNLQQRATWEAQRAFGFSTQADIAVYGWRDEAGKLWEPGHQVFVYCPALKIDQSMLIEAVQFQQDDNTGTIATLTVVNPEAYGCPGGASGSGSFWAAPFSSGF